MTSSQFPARDTFLDAAVLPDDLVLDLEGLKQEDDVDKASTEKLSVQIIATNDA